MELQMFLKKPDIPNSHSAFTLLELLVVIAVISVLAGLLVPALISAKAKVRSVHCKNNLKQLGIAMRIYADDNSERYPRIKDSAGTVEREKSPENSAVRKLLEPFLDEGLVFLCKSDSSDSFYQGGSSYKWNSDLNGKLVDGGSHLASKSTRVLLFDSVARHSGARNAVFEDGSITRY